LGVVVVPLPPLPPVPLLGVVVVPLPLLPVLLLSPELVLLLPDPLPLPEPALGVPLGVDPEPPCEPAPGSLPPPWCEPVGAGLPEAGGVLCPPPLAGACGLGALGALSIGATTGGPPYELVVGGGASGNT
jgi:hypothetical protein